MLSSVSTGGMMLPVSGGIPVKYGSDHTSRLPPEESSGSGQRKRRALVPAESDDDDPKNIRD